MFPYVWFIEPLFVIIFNSLGFSSKIRNDCSSNLQYVLYASIRFCFKNLSILKNVPTLNTMPDGETVFTPDDFGAIVLFRSRSMF